MADFRNSVVSFWPGWLLLFQQSYATFRTRKPTLNLFVATRFATLWFFRVSQPFFFRYFGVSFFQGGAPEVACRCSCLLGSGRWVGDEAAPRVSGGGRSISCTMVHRACAVQRAGAVREVSPTDA